MNFRRDHRVDPIAGDEWELFRVRITVVRVTRKRVLCRLGFPGEEGKSQWFERKEWSLALDVPQAILVCRGKATPLVGKPPD